jgi:DNA-binding XRE family transcriptional regulator
MREVGNWFWEAFALDYLGVVAANEGAIDEAVALISEALAHRRAGGDVWGEAESLERLGLLSLRRRALAEAHVQLSASLRLRHALEDKLGLARGLEALAAVAAAADQLVRAAQLLGAAETLRESLGAIVLPPEQAEHQRTDVLARRGLGEDAFRAARDAGRGLSVAGALETATAAFELARPASSAAESTTDASIRSEHEGRRSATRQTASESAIFGALLQRRRLAAGLSQAELAERAGLSQRGISDLERDLRRAPYPATIRRIAEALALSEEERAELQSASRRQRPPPGTGSK